MFVVPQNEPQGYFRRFVSPEAGELLVVGDPEDPRPDPTAVLGACLPRSLKQSEWWCPSYLADWLLVLLLIVPIVLIVTVWDPYVRDFFACQVGADGRPLPGCTDNSYQYARRADSVSVMVSGIVNILVPVVLMILVDLLRKDRHSLHNALLGFCEAIIITYLTQLSMTKAVGKLRPDFLSRVVADEDIKDGRLSFPSGHTAVAFAGLGFFSLFLAGKLRVYQWNRGNFWRLFLVLLPLAGALAQALSRITDFKHHEIDVVTGALVGAVGAGLAYFLNFPALSHPLCFRAKNRKRVMYEYLNTQGRLC
eukprot:NODE_3015_length_1046_cov_40.064200_g2873_i0.p1 GENE.NODE_3015_length_1046_cov_40.064200_g2873_i0~~NODE_3015_length_1046_cov_40.064200_g2873_i0.p1  ORF type:complete len:308 (+),score=85.95 NODE_3015_length_1046_cov_40.064200_g2873_i0:56-979(+)